MMSAPSPLGGPPMILAAGHQYAEVDDVEIVYIAARCRLCSFLPMLLDVALDGRHSRSCRGLTASPQYRCEIAAPSPLPLTASILDRTAITAGRLYDFLEQKQIFPLSRRRKHSPTMFMAGHPRGPLE